MSPTHPAAREWTYAEFARLPDGNRYEVIAGELYGTPAPGSIHQRVSSRLVHLFEGSCDEHGMVGAPDLVVEILSETTAGRDRGITRERYAAYGFPSTGSSTRTQRRSRSTG